MIYYIVKVQRKINTCAIFASLDLSGSALSVDLRLYIALKENLNDPH